MEKGDGAYPSPAEKATDDRTFTVHGGKILQLPTLTIADLRIASSPEGKAFVQERIHDEDMNGFPLVELYKDHGVVLQPLNSSTTHVLVVLNDEKALEMMAMIHHTYNLLGYTLIYDGTTVFHTREKREEETSSENSALNSENKKGAENDKTSTIHNRQSTLDVLGMEVA